MQRAEVTRQVWRALLAGRRGQAAACPPRASAAERAAFALYAPLAGPGASVMAQIGQSLDGRIATVTGDARDISGEEGLRHLHRCRALADAVLVGVSTALADDPRLTVRLVEGPNPARVVIDPRGRLPDTAAALVADGARRIVIQACARRRPAGVEVVTLPAPGGWIAPQAIRAALEALGLQRLLIEGGGVTVARFLEAGLLDRLHVAIAPLIIGAGPAGLSTTPIARLADALRPETRVYGMGIEVVFDCAFSPRGTASTSVWPTVQTAAKLTARRA